MAITRFEDLPSENSPINSENLNGNFDELGVKVGTSVDNNYRTNIIKGNNLFNKNNLEIAVYDYSATGVIPPKISSTTRCAVGPYTPIKVKPNTKYTFSSIDDIQVSIGELKSDRTLIQSINWTQNTLTITTTANTEYIVFNIKYSNDTTITSTIFETIQNAIMLNEGTSALAYEPYITPNINVDGEEIYSKGAVLYDGGTAGSDLSSPITFNDSLANYERIEIYYGTTRPYYISSLYSNYGQHTYFEPSLQFYYPNNADSSFYIYITLLNISQNAMGLHSTRGSRTVTVSSSGAITNTKSTTSSSIKIFKVIGYK